MALLADLRRALLELRAIPPPPSGQVSGAYGAPFIYIRCTSRVVLQPFESIRAFHDMLFQSCGVRSRMPHLLKPAEPVYAKEHRLCFTHSDLHIRNILVKDGRLAGIINWETAGRFPEYWEYTMLEIRTILNVQGRQFFFGMRSVSLVHHTRRNWNSSMIHWISL
ncbi:hypothetical protein IW262DRAFT_129364 [Armillaria fumosa]|nr:hypothetical protein IW262DRAFT_129364 [Armillaria fumosa]